MSDYEDQSAILLLFEFSLLQRQNLYDSALYTDLILTNNIGNSVLMDS